MEPWADDFETESRIRFVAIVSLLTLQKTLFLLEPWVIDRCDKMIIAGVTANQYPGYLLFGSDFQYLTISTIFGHISLAFPTTGSFSTHL